MYVHLAHVSNMLTSSPCFLNPIRKFTYIPVLPSTMAQVLQSFLPFIVGCHGSMCDGTKFPRDVVVVDLDHRHLLGCGLPFPALPAPLVQASWTGAPSEYAAAVDALNGGDGSNSGGGGGSDALLSAARFVPPPAATAVAAPTVFSYNSMPTFPDAASSSLSSSSAPLSTFALASPSKSVAASLLYTPCFVAKEDDENQNAATGGEASGGGGSGGGATGAPKGDDALTRASFARLAEADAQECEVRTVIPHVSLSSSGLSLNFSYICYSLVVAPGAWYPVVPVAGGGGAASRPPPVARRHVCVPTTRTGARIRACQYVGETKHCSARTIMSHLLLSCSGICLLFTLILCCYFHLLCQLRRRSTTPTTRTTTWRTRPPSPRSTR